MTKSKVIVIRVPEHIYHIEKVDRPHPENGQRGGNDSITSILEYMVTLYKDISLSELARQYEFTTTFIYDKPPIDIKARVSARTALNLAEMSERIKLSQANITHALLAMFFEGVEA